MNVTQNKDTDFSSFVQYVLILMQMPMAPSTTKEECFELVKLTLSLGKNK